MLHIYRQSSNNAKGMMIIDKSGLCLECISLCIYSLASGTLKSRFAINESGFFRDMSQKCALLLDDEASEAVIEIRTDKQYFIIIIILY